MNPILSMLNSTSKEQQTTVPSVKQSGNMLKDFADFKKQMQGKDAKSIIDGLRASGKMSDKQYKDLVTRAETLQSILK